MTIRTRGVPAVLLIGRGLVGGRAAGVAAAAPAALGSARRPTTMAAAIRNGIAVADGDTLVLVSPERPASRAGVAGTSHSHQRRSLDGTPAVKPVAPSHPRRHLSFNRASDSGEASAARPLGSTQPVAPSTPVSSRAAAASRKVTPSGGFYASLHVPHGGGGSGHALDGMGTPTRHAGQPPPTPPPGPPRERRSLRDFRKGSDTGPAVAPAPAPPPPDAAPRRGSFDSPRARPATSVPSHRSGLAGAAGDLFRRFSRTPQGGTATAMTVPMVVSGAVGAGSPDGSEFPAERRADSRPRSRGESASPSQSPVQSPTGHVASRAAGLAPAGRVGSSSGNEWQGWEDVVAGLPREGGGDEHRPQTAAAAAFVPGSPGRPYTRGGIAGGGVSSGGGRLGQAGPSRTASGTTGATFWASAAIGPRAAAHALLSSARPSAPPEAAIAAMKHERRALYAGAQPEAGLASPAPSQRPETPVGLMRRRQTVPAKAMWQDY